MFMQTYENINIILSDKDDEDKISVVVFYNYSWKVNDVMKQRV